ncbi:hypothetical protein PIB30_066101 [Stylosanthes scabra]|uniref:Uncharacterized protein n=1 Tax=Stylosanthes scabra TaxID=79078 RepID=A0ABU6RM81_9FABA|nr:hypothetical protein [Stylosanthes scabra]
MRAILDHKFKSNTLVYCYGEIDPVGAKDKVELVKSKLYKLFEFYDRNSSTVAVGASQSSSVISQVAFSSTSTDLMPRNQEAEVKSDEQREAKLIANGDDCSSRVGSNDFIDLDDDDDDI